MVLYGTKERGVGSLVLQPRAKLQKASWVIKIIQRHGVTFREAQTFSSTAVRVSSFATDTELVN
jgi:hypothetical protein